LNFGKRSGQLLKPSISATMDLLGFSKERRSLIFFFHFGEGIENKINLIIDK